MLTQPPPGKRHIGGNEQYDQDMNIIVPAKERRMYQYVQQMDAEMSGATVDFFQSENELDRMLDEYTKLLAMVQDHYQVIICGPRILIMIFVLLNILKYYQKYKYYPCTKRS